MPITEIALLRLLPPTSPSDSSLLTKLSHAKQVMQDYTNRTFYYLQQLEDPTLIYIIGEWDSLDQHMNHFIPSPANQTLLETLKNDLTVEYLIHIDTPQDDLPIPRTGDHIVGIVRHFINPGEKGNFTETFETNKKYLEHYVTEARGSIKGGWRIDHADDEPTKDEFVLFHPWENIQQHESFAATEEFEKYGKIREFLEGVEIKHARLMEF